MRLARRALGLVLVATCGCAPDSEPQCIDGTNRVSVDEPLRSLEGDTPRERFDRAAGPWSCSVTWVALPSVLGTQIPAPSSSALELTLERTSDEARYREYARTTDQKLEGLGCQTDAVFVPCSLALSSDDGALDEMLDCELRLQGDNTYVHLVLPDYEFSGSHTVTFVDDIPRDSVELGVVFTPGAEPTRIDGSIVESGTRVGRGQNPLATTALIGCTPR